MSVLEEIYLKADAHTMPEQHNATLLLSKAQQQPSVVVVLTAVALLVLVLFCSPPSKCSFSGHRSQAARFALISRCYCMLLCGTVAPHSRLVCARVLHICSVKRTWQRCSSCTHRNRGPLLSRHNQGRLVCVHALCFLLCCLRSLRENNANANTQAQQQHVATLLQSYAAAAVRCGCVYLCCRVCACGVLLHESITPWARCMCAGVL